MGSANADHAGRGHGLEPRPGWCIRRSHPTCHGYEAARAAGIRRVAVFAAASEAFCGKNTNCSIAESLKRFENSWLRPHSMVCGARVRFVRSGCPYQGEVSPDDVAELAGNLFAMGCDEISLGDTIGVGTPGTTLTMIDAVERRVPVPALACHFHDTYVRHSPTSTRRCREASACSTARWPLGRLPLTRPAPPATWPLKILVYLLHGLGIGTGVDLDRLAQAGEFICEQLGKPTRSRTRRPGPQNAWLHHCG